MFFWAFEVVGSSNIISVLLTDSAVSLKWLTVTLKIEMGQRHGTNCFLGVPVVGSWNLFSILVTELTVSLKWLTVTLKIETG